MQREQATHASRRRFLQGMGVGVAGMAAEGHAQTSGVKPLRGIFPIAQSPFTQDDTLDLDGLAAQVGFCNRGGVHGFVWPQIVSAWTTLSEKQRLDGAEAILAAGKRGRAALVIGVQTVDGNLEGAIRYAKHAEKHGADAIICIPPTRMTDDRGVLEYYKALGHATELPLILQSQGNMSVDVVVRMSQEIPTMPVVKDEAGNALVRINEVRDRTKGKLGVFSGHGVRTLITEMELGFAGHCPTMALADVYAAAFDLYHAGKRNEAFDMFGRILAFNSIPGPQNSVLMARGVFKATTKFHPLSFETAPAGGERITPFDPEQGKKMMREALNTYLRPYLRA